MEAAGVEPASETVAGKEPTCVAGSCPGPSPGTFANGAQSRQETPVASLWISPWRPDGALQASLLCDALPRPADKIAEDGYLQLGSKSHFRVGTYGFAHDYGCVHPGMPPGRKSFRRSRDAPTCMTRAVDWQQPD